MSTLLDAAWCAARRIAETDGEAPRCPLIRINTIEAKATRSEDVALAGASKPGCNRSRPT